MSAETQITPTTTDQPLKVIAPEPHLRERLAPMLQWEVGLVVLLVATCVMGSQMSSRFLLPGNFFYIGLNIGEIAIMAIPVTLIVITGEIDLSITSTLELAGVTMGWLFAHGWPIEAAMAAALCVGAAAGAFNGFLVTRLGLPSMIVTIGTLTLYEGIGQILLPQTSVGGFPTTLTNIGIFPIPHTQVPYSIGFFVIIALVTGVVLHKTPLGRAIYAIGTNREASFFSGVRVKRIKMWLFIASGLLSAFCGILWTLRFASARYDMASGLELNVVAIVFFAGTAFTGGKGSVIGVVLAASIFAGVQNAVPSTTFPHKNRTSSSVACSSQACLSRALLTSIDGRARACRVWADDISTRRNQLQSWQLERLLSRHRHRVLERSQRKLT